MRLRATVHTGNEQTPNKVVDGFRSLINPCTNWFSMEEIMYEALQESGLSRGIGTNRDRQTRVETNVEAM